MRSKLISYALSFTSFLLEKGVEPRKVILFGSVVTGEFDDKSDVDIFIDIDKAQEDRIKNILKIFNKTFGEKWRLKGISNPLSMKVGNLDGKEWTDLRRSIQSYGLILYGPYTELPKNIKSFLLFRLNFGKISRAKKVSIWRKLYGYVQKINRKKYEKEGIVKELEGRKLEKSIVIIPSQNSKKFKDFLKKNKVGFLVDELWSDSF